MVGTVADGDAEYDAVPAGTAAEEHAAVAEAGVGLPGMALDGDGTEGAAAAALAR